MLAPIELPAHVEQLDQQAHALSARLRAVLGGEPIAIPAGADLLSELRPGYLHIVDGFISLRRGEATLRYFDAGLWLATAAWPGDMRLSSEFDTHAEWVERGAFVAALAGDASLLSLWLDYERCQQQVLAAICAELSTPDPNVRTGLSRHVAGSLIARAGEQLEQLLVLVDGEAQAELDGVVLGSIHQAEFIGEIGFLTDSGCGADVRALTDCLVQTIPRDAFEDIARSRPEMVLQMARTLAERLARANHRQLEVARPAIPRRT